MFFFQKFQKPYVPIRMFFFQKFQNSYLPIRMFFFGKFQKPYVSIRMCFRSQMFTANVIIFSTFSPSRRCSIYGAQKITHTSQHSRLLREWQPASSHAYLRTCLRLRRELCTQFNPPRREWFILNGLKNKRKPTGINDKFRIKSQFWLLGFPKKSQSRHIKFPILVFGVREQ